MAGDPLYIPKGGMCAVCSYKYRDCSYKNFEHMQVLERVADPEGFYDQIVVVRCADFARGPAEPVDIDIEMQQMDINTDSPRYGNIGTVRGKVILD